MQNVTETGASRVGRRYADELQHPGGPYTPEDAGDELSPYRKDTDAHREFVAAYAKRHRELTTNATTDATLGFVK